MDRNRAAPRRAPRWSRRRGSSLRRRRARDRAAPSAARTPRWERARAATPLASFRLPVVVALLAAGLALDVCAARLRRLARRRALDARAPLDRARDVLRVGEV